MLRQFATQCSATARPTIPHAPAPANRASTSPAATSLTEQLTSKILYVL